MRAPCPRLPCSSTAETPLRLSWRASAFAPYLVRVKTIVRPGALVRSTSTGRRCSRSTCSTWWVISATGDCAESAWWVTGWFRNSRTRPSTALSSVAENNRRWLRGGVRRRSRRTPGRKPRSAMWSASSSTVTSTSSRVQAPWPIRSSSRPGQATRMSTPRRSALTWGPWPTPPKTVRVLQTGYRRERSQGSVDLADELTRRGQDQSSWRARASRPAVGQTSDQRAAGRRRSCPSRCGHGRARRARRGSRAGSPTGWEWGSRCPGEPGRWTGVQARRGL